MERAGDVPSGTTPEDCARICAPALTGGPFTPERGYDGPGRGTPVAVRRTPWRQAIDGRPCDRADRIGFRDAMLDILAR